MCDLRPELCVDGKTAVKCFSRASCETEGEFALKHENTDSWWVWEGEELKDERGGNLSALLEMVTRLRYVGTYLIWSIRNANIKCWQLSLDDISKQNLQSLLHRRALHTLCDFSGHARINFDGDDFLCCFQDADCQVTSSWTDFEDDIGRLKVGLLNNSFCDTRILQDVLAESGIELEDVVGLALGLLIWCRSGRAILLSFLNFAHNVIDVKYKSDDEVG